MSVWSDPHYRSEPLIVLTQYLSPQYRLHPNVLALCDFRVEDYGSFDVRVPSGNFRDSVVSGKASVAQLAYKYGARRSFSFEQLFGSLQNVKFGIDAVYSLFAHTWRGNLAFSSEFDQSELKQFCSNLSRTMGPSSYSSPDAWEKHSKSIYENWDSSDKRSCLYWFQQSEGIKHLLVASRATSHQSLVTKAVSRQQPLPHLPPRLIFDKPKQVGLERPKEQWKVYRHESVTIIVRRKPSNLMETWEEVSYVLLNKDVKRWSQMVESTGKILYYFSFYGDRSDMLASKMTDSAKEILDLLCGAFDKADGTQKNSICRSMDIVQYWYLSEFATDIWDRALKDQVRKAHDGLYDVVFPVDKLKSIISAYKPREALELCSIRKMLPVPDFCLYGAQEANRKLHYNPFPLLEHPQEGVDWDDFRLYWSHSMIRNYYHRHDKCPGVVRENAAPKDWHAVYPYIEPKHVPYHDIGDIDWYGTFVFADYNYAEHELKKDKTMAPKRFSEKMTSEELKELPLYERNQIAGFMLNPQTMRLAEIRKQMIAGTEEFDYVHLVAMKPEAKKEGGRLFYMGNDPQRTVLSEFEANVASYLVCKPGNSSGVSDIELARSMNEIATPPLSAVRHVMISFDLEKFSPRQNPRLKVEATKLWAHAFGLPHIEPLLKIHTGSRLAFIKHGIHHEYINPGQDLEGYNAKMNTAMHIDVMSYAINVCRRSGLLKKGASLLALIDDGGMRLEFDHDTTNAQILECVRCIEQVYEMVGLRISWDKTFVSGQLFQYLNEIYYRGKKVTPGLKAFLRVGKEVDVPSKTIVDDLDAVAGEIQGAIKSGTSYMTAYNMYLFEVFRIMKRWGKYKIELRDQHVLMCLVPIAFGGLGVRSLIQLATNEAFNPVTAGVGNLKAFCKFYPGNSSIVNDILNASMRQQTPEAFLRAPKAVRVETRTINTQRFANTMRSWLQSAAMNPFVRSVLAATEGQSSSVLAVRVKEMEHVSSVGLLNLSNLRPEAAVDMLVNKLQRSQTAADILGFRTVLQITISNRFQAQHLMRDFANEFYVHKLKFASARNLSGN